MSMHIYIISILTAYLALTQDIRGYSTIPSAEEELHTLIYRYHRLPAYAHSRTNAGLIAWLRHYRCSYACSERPIPIAIIDNLTARDILFIQALHNILLRHAYAHMPTHSAMPTLTRLGNMLVSQAEEQLIAHTAYHHDSSQAHELFV